MRTVIAYTRVSTEEQANVGVSLAAQERQLRAHCDARSLALLRVECDEGVSGSRLRTRAGLQRALASLRTGEACGLVVTKLDRLSRSTRDVLDLVALADRQGWELHSLGEQLVTSSPHGRFFVTMLAGLAQMEREQIAERTRAGMAETLVIRRQSPSVARARRRGRVARRRRRRALVFESMTRTRANAFGRGFCRMGVPRNPSHYTGHCESPKWLIAVGASAVL